MLDKIDTIIEECILNMYRYSINFILSDIRFKIEKSSIGLDIIANQNFEKGDVLWEPFIILNLYSKEIIRKYSSYVYKDYYIIDGFGMLLNNKDRYNNENCTFDENRRVFIATTSIKQGESIRMDYHMNTDEYPPIPEEIKSLRSTMVV